MKQNQVGRLFIQQESGIQGYYKGQEIIISCKIMKWNLVLYRFQESRGIKYKKNSIIINFVPEQKHNFN